MERTQETLCRKKLLGKCIFLAINSLSAPLTSHIDPPVDQSKADCLDDSTLAPPFTVIDLFSNEASSE